MIPGLEEFTKTGSTAIMEAYIKQLEQEESEQLDQAKMLIESAHLLLHDYKKVCKEQGWASEDIDNWIAMADRWY